MKIYELFDVHNKYDEGRVSCGLFASEEAIRAHLLYRVMTGQGLKSAEIVEQEITGEPEVSAVDLDWANVQSFQVVGGPWSADARIVLDRSGAGLFRVSSTNGTVGDDEVITAAIVRLVNAAMEGRWTA